MTIRADLRHLIYALSDSLDLVGVDDVGHGKRVGMMAVECGRRKGLTEPELAFLFDLGLLHDIGVSSTQVHRHIVSKFEWADSQVHCESGYALLKTFPPLAPLALPVKHHHTHWEQLLSADTDPTIAWQANLIFLVDRVDTLAIPHHADGTLWQHAEEIRGQIRQRSGATFAPDLVACFLEASASEGFWLLSRPQSIQAYVQAMLSQGPSYEASMGELRQLAETFSRIVDAKSPFTAEHSKGVAGLARLLAERMGLGEGSCAAIEIAGLLHDVGKLRVPDEILDKPGSLDPWERRIINAHSRETYQILGHLKGFEEIALWASYHHEDPAGHGPFHLDSRALPIEARILRIADIFQAMVQDRPYRKGLDRELALAFLENLARKGEVEPELVTLVISCGEAAMVAARAQVPERMGRA